VLISDAWRRQITAAEHEELCEVLHKKKTFFAAKYPAVEQVAFHSPTPPPPPSPIHFH
jgi:hypothetical protein